MSYFVINLEAHSFVYISILLLHRCNLNMFVIIIYSVTNCEHWTAGHHVRKSITEANLRGPSSLPQVEYLLLVQWAGALGYWLAPLSSGFGSRLGGLKETKNVSPPSTCESQYCGEPT